MEKIVSRFRGKLAKMIRDVDSKFDDHSISPKIGQILLHWIRFFLLLHWIRYYLLHKIFLMSCQINV